MMIKLRSPISAGLCITALACCPANLWAEKPFTITPDVVYGHKDGLAMTFDVVKPAKANGAGVLFMVSGGWVSPYTPPESLVRESPGEKNGFEELVEAGFTLFMVRHGGSPKFKVPEAVEDVRRAVRYVRLNAEKFGVDPDRLGAFGFSAGGHLSLMLGTASDEGDSDSADPIDRTGDRVAAVVAFFPPTDLRDLVGPNPRFPALDFDKGQADSVSPILHVTDDDAPTLLIHGDKDTLVPLSHSENIKKAFDEKKVICELMVVEGGGHGFFEGENQRKATEALVGWFEKHLAK